MYINTYNPLHRYNGLRNNRIENPRNVIDMMSGDPFKRGLVGHWKSIGNVATSGTWYDISGNGNHGTLNGDAFVDVNGLNCDGSGDYAALIRNGFPSGDQERTLLAIIKPTAVNSYRCIMSHGTPNVGNAGFGFSVKDGRLIAQNGVADYIGDIVISANVRYFVATTYKSGSLKTYVDGIQDKVFSISALSTGTTEASIGSWPPAPNIVFQGFIYESFFYNRELSSLEISQLYYQTKGYYI